MHPRQTNFPPSHTRLVQLCFESSFEADLAKCQLLPHPKTSQWAPPPTADFNEAKLSSFTCSRIVTLSARERDRDREDSPVEISGAHKQTNTPRYRQKKQAQTVEKPVTLLSPGR